MIDRALQVLEVFSALQGAFEFVFVVDLDLESIVEILHVRLQLQVLLAQSAQLHVLLRVLYLNDIELALPTLQILLHLLDLSLFKLFLLDLEYLRLEINDALL